MFGDHGAHGVPAARPVEEAGDNAQGPSASRLCMGATTALARHLKRSSATLGYVQVNNNNCTSVLLVLAIKSILGEARYGGGEVYTKESFLYGRFEVRMKSAEGGGIVSSFFLYNICADESEVNPICRK